MGKLWLLAIAFHSVLSFAQQSYSILQGSTSETVSNFTVVAPASEKLNFVVREAGKIGAAVEAQRFGYDGSEWIVYRFKATGLRPNVQFELEVRNERNEVVDQRKFKALDVNKTDARIAVGSCMLRQLHNPFLWNNLEKPENRPDLLMITGDATYLDRANLLKARKPQNGLAAWEEFVKSRQTEGLYFWRNLVPTVTMWDDHDSGGDNVDSNFELMQEIGRIYSIFFPNDPIEGFMQAGPGMARQFKAFGKNFILLDGRTFRNQWLSSPLLGHDQERWLLRMMTSGANFLVNGTQFFGGPIKKDSLEYNWPDYSKELMAKLKDHSRWKNSTIAFLSGDVHFSEVQDVEPEHLGYWTVEITSSNIHSFGFPGHYFLKPNNPRRRNVTGTHNIVLLEFSPETDAFAFKVRSMGWRGNDLFKTVVSIAPPKYQLAPLSDCELKLAAHGAR